MVWQCVYLAVAIAVTILYGIRALVLWKTEEKRVFELVHHVWANAACSAMGFHLTWWTWNQLRKPDHKATVGEVLFAIAGALGITGFLPQTLNAVPALL